MDIYGNIMQTACTLAGEDVSPGYPHTVTGALDALADVLAGEDVDAGHTIAEAVAAVGENIGGGGGPELGLPVYIEARQGESTVIITHAVVSHNGSIASRCDEVEGFYSASNAVVEMRIDTMNTITAQSYYEDESEHWDTFTDFTATVDAASGQTDIRFTVPELPGRNEVYPGFVTCGELYFSYSGE